MDLPIQIDAEADNYDGDDECNVIPRSGHISVSFGNFILVWGGYTEWDIDEIGPHMVWEDRYLNTNTVWVYGVETERWSRVTTFKQIPPGTSGASGVVVNSQLYIFGGHTEPGNTNELFKLNLTTLVWEHIPVLHKPSPRDKFAMWAYEDNLYVFGGFGPPMQTYLCEHGQYEYDTPTWNSRGWNNQLFCFNLADNSWKNLHCTGNVPTPRAAHRIVCVGKTAYIFGGRHQNTRLNDMYTLDMESLCWTKLVPSGEVPCGRSWHTLSAVDDSQLFLYGGYTQDNKPLSDAWVFDLVRREWTQIQVPSNQPRLWHTSAVSAEGDIVIFGGCSSDILNTDEPSKHSGKALVFRCSPKSLLRLCLDSVHFHRLILESEWDSLPLHLQQRLRLRVKGTTSSADECLGPQGRTCVVS